MILGELFVEVVPDTLLAGQVIIDLAGGPDRRRPPGAGP